MTVVLSGIGADTTNLGALAPLYDDGRFEYVPIPEKTRHTDERRTFGSWPLRHGDGVAADLTASIRPRPVREPELRVDGTDLESWPVHHDPNFEAATYGEHRTSGYVERLRRLDPGDVVGFYAGLRDGDGRAHRYLIGYVTVAGVDVVSPEAPASRRERLLERHAANAHAKRARGNELYLEKPVVIVDGNEPTVRFDRDPVRLSAFETRSGNQRPSYYLREAVAERLCVVEGGSAMAYKPAYLCDLSGDAFRDRVGTPGDRRRLNRLREGSDIGESGNS